MIVRIAERIAEFLFYAGWFMWAVKSLVSWTLVEPMRTASFANATNVGATAALMGVVWLALWNHRTGAQS
jgi:hypothetical protein